MEEKEFEVEIYELYASKVRVKAKSRAEAILAVQDGQGVPLEWDNQPPEFIETVGYNTLGNLESENPGIIGELEAAGEEVDLSCSTIIRSIEEV